MIPETLPKSCGKEGFCQQVRSAGYNGQEGDSSYSCDASLTGQLSVVSLENTTREKDEEMVGRRQPCCALNNFLELPL